MNTRPLLNLPLVLHTKLPNEISACSQCRRTTAETSDNVETKSEFCATIPEENEPEEKNKLNTWRVKKLIYTYYICNSQSNHKFVVLRIETASRMKNFGHHKISVPLRKPSDCSYVPDLFIIDAGKFSFLRQ